jgi:SNF2 family DNA or RNA helicase
MLMMEESLLRGGINASDCGTGKTVTCLGIIEQSAKLQAEAVAAGTLVNHTYKPTLVACPSQLVDVWYDDWNQFFSGPDRLVLKQFYGSEAIITNPTRKATLLGTMLEHLTHYLKTLDPLAPATARVVIVTAYSTWHKRTLMAEEAPHEENSKGKGRAAAAAATDEGYDPDDEDELATANPRMIYTSSLKHHFDRVICDEAHALKNPGTLTHLAIKHLEASKMWFVSATPMINHVRDLGGYLALLWDEDWTLGEDLDLEDFYAEILDASTLIDGIDESKVGLITAINKGHNVFQLDPHRYRIVTGGDRPDSSLVGLALRAILSQIQLRHTMATVIDMGDGQMLPIGENIPHYRVTTVELRMSRAQSQRYQQIYDQHVGSLYTGAAIAACSDRNSKPSALGPEEPRGRLNMFSHRRLVHATLNTHLETLVCSVGKRSLVKDINRWYESAKDFGVTHFFRHTRPAPYFQPYQDRLSMAEYMSGPSVKIQYLCLLLHKICIVDGKRVQIVVDMPMNQW